MLKSEIYHKLQFSVLKDSALNNIERLEMLKELMKQETWELHMERAAKEAEAE